MNKTISTFYLLIIFLPVAYAQPSDDAINNAVTWAQSLVGQKSFPLVNVTGISRSFFSCSDFVANAYGWPAASYYAYQLWDISDQHLGDTNAPRGSLVFFDRTTENFGAGHVALSLGNGDLIEAGYDVIIQNTIAGENHYARYLGWAWPRSAWPGRSGGTAPINIAIPITLAIVVILGSSVVLQLIRSRKFKRLRLLFKYVLNGDRSKLL